MALTDSLRILITANGAQAEREFTKVGAAAKKNLGIADTSAQRLGRSLTAAGVGMAVFGGVALLGLYKAAQGADEAERALLKLQNSIARSPQLVGTSTAAFVAQAEALEDVTVHTAEAGLESQAMLATFRLTEDQITSLTPLVADVASKFDVDMVRAATNVGKAMNGSISALQRWGINIDPVAYETDRFSAIMDGLRENAGGFAENEGQTMAGQLEILKNSFGEVTDAIGVGVIQAFNDLIGPVQATTEAFGRLNPDTQAMIGRIATFGSVGLIAAGGISFLAGQVMLATTRFKALAVAARTANLTAVAGAAPWAALAVAIALAANKWNLMEEETSGVEDSLDGAALAGQSAAEMFETLADGAGFVAIQLEEATRMAGQLAATDPGSLGEFAELLGNVGYNAAEVAGIITGAIPGALGMIDGVGTASEGAMGGLDGLGDSADEAGDAFDELSTRIDEYLGITLGVEEAQAGLEGSLDDLRASLEENGNTWDDNTEAGRNNIAAGNDIVRNVGDVIRAVMDEAEATDDYTGAQRTSNGAMQNAIGQLRGMRDSGRLSADQYRILRDRILGIPHGIPGAEGIISDLQRIYGAAQDAANAIGQIGGSLAGGGTYTPPSGNNTPSGGLRGRDEAAAELGRSIARELSKIVQPVVVVG